MQKHYLNAIRVVFIVAIACGCSMWKDNFAAKRKHDLERAQQDCNSKSPIFRRFGTNLYPILVSAREDQLNKPQFVMAAMVKNLNGEYWIFVYWLENSVTVDSVELDLGKTQKTLVIPISPNDLLRNMKARNLSITRAVSWKWEVSNSVWNKFEQLTNVSDIRIRLSRKRTGITAWHPVVYYKIDRWMGSKQITEIRN